VHLTRALALELARYQIRVNAICPGYFPSEMTAEYLSGPKGEGLIHRIPQRRLGAHADLEGPLLLLASDAGAYMTGSVLVVDGGYALTTEYENGFRAAARDRGLAPADRRFRRGRDHAVGSRRGELRRA
jgi:Dehydrogenases with different specificities (related to short-chain alcohol dehydrogenases)